jgi:P-type Cu2+ transporter
LADRAVFWLTLIAVAAALLALVGWTLARGFDEFAVERAATTLVVACPHALGLAIPLVIAISTTLSDRSGILVRDRMALEAARDLDVVVFDKTGTLTRGEQGLVELATTDGFEESEALSLAAAVEGDSEHMVARALIDAARERGPLIPAVHGFQSLPGRGAEARIDTRVLQVGGPRLLEQARVQLPSALAERAAAWCEHGQTVLYLLERREAIAAFALADVIRPESPEAIARLEGQNVRVVMLTGDSDDVARWVAAEQPRVLCGCTTGAQKREGPRPAARRSESGYGRRRRQRRPRPSAG